MLRSLAAAAATIVACALGTNPIHPQAGATGSGNAPSSPLVLARDWSPVSVVTMALPVPVGTSRDALLARAYDRALLAALQNAAGGTVQVTYSRDDTGRYFVALTSPGAARSTLRAMQEIVRTGPASPLIDAAVAGIGADLGFRGDLPRSWFETVLAAQLEGRAEADAPDPEPLALEGLGDEVRAAAARLPWGPPVWVVVGDDAVASAFPATGAAPDTAGRPPVQPLHVAPAEPPGVPEPLRTHIPSDAVTRWVGSVFRFPPGTTLVEAVVLRLVLEEALERVRGPNLFELTTGIDVQGRLVVRFSTSADAGVRWESRLDDAIAEIASQPTSIRLNQSLRPARSHWSRELSSAAGAARAAAEALLRGASDRQAAAFADSAGAVPDAERVSAVARGLGLSIRVVYGTN